MGVQGQGGRLYVAPTGTAHPDPRHKIGTPDDPWTLVGDVVEATFDFVESGTVPEFVVGAPLGAVVADDVGELLLPGTAIVRPLEDGEH